MSKKFLIVAITAFVASFLVFIGLRVVLLKNTDVHYHANFGLFVDGKRDMFKNFTYYEEIAACSTGGEDNPKHNIHMHDNKFDVIHVHAHGATWGAFFANLGYTLGNKVIVTENGTFVDGQDGKKLQFLLNGELVTNVQGRLIESTDTLLVSYGTEDDKALQSEYKQIDRSADRYNHTKDPAACSGAHELTFTTRLKRAFNFSE